MEIPSIVRAYIEAYNAMDVGRMLECLAEDVRFQNISSGQVDVETAGKERFAELAEVGVAAFRERRQDVTGCIVVGAHTMVEIAYTATVAADLPNGWKAGQRLAFSGASYFRTANGRIAEIVDQS
ncbi:nuclear transport factor 2 family protein [Microvirga sp. GCM10011540]|uniref:nuclear transport factor 2 family protein n=1 Tax=Microvirga sp. GCM10011540 TaxID=3317338 RepID=UPI0036175B05